MKNAQNLSSSNSEPKITGSKISTDFVSKYLDQSYLSRKSAPSNIISTYLSENNAKNTSYNYVSPGSYKSNIAPRNTVISKRCGIPKLQLSHTESNYYSNKAISIRPNKSIEAIDTRNKEKQQLKELNEIFASYVERVKFLEASNKKLHIELEALKNRQGNGTKQIEIMYQIELEEAKHVLSDTEKLKNTIESKLSKNDFDLEELKQKSKDLENSLVQDKARIKILQEQILSNEAEIGLLRRRLSDLYLDL